MRLKADWKLYIQKLREDELEIIKHILFEYKIKKGLELGAGNGFQSRMLKNYIEDLYCTELNKERLIQQDIDGIKYKIADAELIDNYFRPKYFDFIYSSNLFEHLPNPHLAIISSRKILKDDGLMIHIIPSSFSVILRIVLWYPNLVISIIEKLSLKNKKSNNKHLNKSVEKRKGNNIKLDRKGYSKLRNLLIPTPHGVSNSIFREIKDMNKKKWKKQFYKNGFTIIALLKGPIYSGYGLGWRRMKYLLRKIGFTSEYIYIMKKY